MQCTQCGSPIRGTPKFCPTCGSPLGPLAVQTIMPRPGARTWKVGLVLFPLVLAAGVGLFYAYLTPGIHPVIKDQPIVAAPSDYDSSTVTMTPVSFREDGGDIVFSLADLLRYRLVRFEVPTPTTIRPVMAYISPDGRVVTAISVSEHCGSTEFILRNNQIECARCPSRWDSTTMEAYACCAKYYPDPVPSRVQGGEVRIPKVFVDKWSGRL